MSFRYDPSLYCRSRIPQTLGASRVIHHLIKIGILDFDHLGFGAVWVHLLEAFWNVFGTSHLPWTFFHTRPIESPLNANMPFICGHGLLFRYIIRLGVSKFSHMINVGVSFRMSVSAQGVDAQYSM